MPRTSKIHTRYLAVLVAAAAALAQTATDKPATAAGTVTNSLTGEPVLRAHVTVRAGGQNTQIYGALTNAEGKFSITPLQPGDYMLSVDRVGFVFMAPYNSAESRSTQFTLGPGDRKDDLKLSLTPTGAITGHVLDAAGEPVEGANVVAQGGNGNGANSTTDDKGQFRLGGLSPGRYRVKASPRTLPFPPEIRSDGTPDIHYATTYYADSLSSKSAQRLEVKSGADVSGIDIHLVRTPIVTVSGKVVGLPAGFKGAYIQVSQGSADGFNVSSQQGTNVKADGSFEMWRLDPGKYTLVASTQVSQTRLQSAPLDIEVTNANLEHLELRMIPPFDIAGQIHYEDEQARQPLRSASRTGQAQQPAPPHRVQLRAEPPGQYLETDIAADDSFTLEKMQPGRYHVALTGASGFVKSVRAGETETDGDILDVRNGSAGPVTVLVSSNYCEVSGTVSDSKGTVAGGSVVLAPAEGSSSFQIAPVDANGTYKLGHIAPGRYKLLAVEDPSAPMANGGAGLDDYEDSIENLDLRPGDKVAKDLKRLPPAGK